MLRPFFLTTIYRLTSAETDLALRLLAGQSLSAAAGPLGITYETARSRLKSIFRKTGTHRQGELVALLARAAARMPTGATRSSRRGRKGSKKI